MVRRGGRRVFDRGVVRRHDPMVRDGGGAICVSTMARYTISTNVAASPDHVFALWTDLERMGEWVGGVTGVTDVSGPVDAAGTTYVVHFGPMKSPTEILEVERPRRFATRFGSWLLRGRSSATFDPDADGTRVTQTFETVGWVSAISSWVFSRGS